MANHDSGGIWGPARVLLVLLGLTQQGVAYAYSGVADVTLSWGVGGTAVSWSSSAQNSLLVADNSSHFTAATGSNAISYFNPDFAAASNYGSGTGDDCLSLLSGYDSIELRKYGCRHRHQWPDRLRSPHQCRRQQHLDQHHANGGRRGRHLRQ